MRGNGTVMFAHSPASLCRVALALEDLASTRIFLGDLLQITQLFFRHARSVPRSAHSPSLWIVSRLRSLSTCFSGRVSGWLGLRACGEECALVIMRTPGDYRTGRAPFVFKWLPRCRFRSIASLSGMLKGVEHFAYWHRRGMRSDR